MKRTAILLTIFSTLATSQHAPAAESLPWRPNILFVMADDQRWDTIGALGNAEVKTPHLDRLVARGYHFNNAYCMGGIISAVCWPSRTMLLTGRSLWRIPQDTNLKTPPAGMPLLPTVLRSARYATFRCGKATSACSFANAAFATNINIDGRTADSAVEHVEKALEFLRNYDGRQPFFIYLEPPVPHDPRLAPRQFSRLYDPTTLSLSRNFLPEHPFDNGALVGRDENLAPHPRTHEAMRRHLADYYATISHLDHELGRLLAAVDQRGLMANTIVIYASDQGLAVGGRHGLMGKQNLYEHVKPPLIVAGSGIPQGQSDALVYLYDLFPTICELAGAPTPAVVEGRSLLPILRGRQTTVREHLFAAYRDCQRMIRDERWKLIQYNAGGIKNTQLFDLQSDADEIHNLADDANHALQRTRLEELMRQARKNFGDPIDFQAATLPRN